MDLTHTFTVPTSIDATWEHFQDIGGLAECFPGAQVTSVGEDADGAPTFEGTCKVKLGPIALVYAGAGKFVERDEPGHRFVVDAKGRDKRGNGTAGAKVTVTMAEAGSETRVEVVTDLNITGKPAQFGRGVMQDVSDKLLGQFVACLEQRLADDGAPSADEDGGAASVPAGEAPAAPSADDQDAGPASTLPPGSSGASGPPRHAAARPAAVAPASNDDALDLGAAVLPVLLKSYGKKVVIGLAALLGVLTVVRHFRR